MSPRPPAAGSRPRARGATFPPPRMALELHFDHGTLVMPTLPPADAAPALASLLVHDARTGTHRAKAHRYREIVGCLATHRVPFTDRARNYDRITLELAAPIAPFPHQEQALAAWVAGGCTGIVELPTGAGKTLLAVLAIRHAGRPALIIVPTIDLMLQWQQVLQKFFDRPIGLLGGGVHDRRDITVTTYDSAAAQTEFHGNCFGLLICDECHHLPAPAYRFIAAGSLAPYRLGLTATLERADGGEAVAIELLGPVRFRAGIDELEGTYLAPYEIHTIEVALDDDEQLRYDEARALYVDHLRKSGIPLNHPSGWARFIAHCHRTDDGRLAFAAYREQRRIAFTAESKIAALWRVLCRHRRDRILIFTEDNDTVYRLSRLFFLPTITHQTKPPERVELLRQFASGELPVLLTSKVLNEGVDVPDANVGVILSGNGSVREHVQRLGRILRKREGKRADLYEIFTAVAAEGRISERRRQHRAYQKGDPPISHHLGDPAAPALDPAALDASDLSLQTDSGEPDLAVTDLTDPPDYHETGFDPGSFDPGSFDPGSFDPPKAPPC
jgi:superfamily II DNA or RNA helicase